MFAVDVDFSRQSFQAKTGCHRPQGKRSNAIAPEQLHGMRNMKTTCRCERRKFRSTANTPLCHLPGSLATAHLLSGLLLKPVEADKQALQLQSLDGGVLHVVTRRMLSRSPRHADDKLRKSQTTTCPKDRPLPGR